MNRKIMRIALWSLSSIALVALFSFVNVRRNHLTCTGALVNIMGDTSLRFVNELELLELMREKGCEYLNTPLDKIDTRKIEVALITHPAIAEADVYLTIDGVLKADVRQREPVLRIIDQIGDSYYIDTNGDYMPLSESFTPMIPVATGAITDPWPKYTRNIQEIMKNDSIQSIAIVDDLYAIAKALRADPLLSAQLLQLYVRPDKDIEMIARVGPEIILFGNKSNLEKKVRNLKLFYSRAMNEPVVEQYTMLNLKYQNQIICTKITQ